MRTQAWPRCRAQGVTPTHRCAARGTGRVADHPQRTPTAPASRGHTPRHTVCGTGSALDAVAPGTRLAGTAHDTHVYE